MAPPLPKPMARPGQATLDPYRGRELDAVRAAAATAERTASSGLIDARQVTLNAKQAEFVFSPYKFGLFIGGVGTGKTFTGCVRSIGAATSMPGSRGAIVAPTYAMMRNVVWPMLWMLLPEAWRERFNENKALLRLKNDAEVLFLSADDPEKLRGLNLTWFWMDEATIAGHSAWQILTQRVGRAGDGRPGWGWATATPKGRDGYWREFEGPEKQPQPGRHLIRSSTFDNLDNLPDGFIASLNFSGPFYDQEVLGLFSAFEGLVYSLFDADELSPTSNVRAPDPDAKFGYTIGGVDWGGNNPCATVVVGMDGDDVGWVLAERYMSRKDYGSDVEDRHLSETVDLTRQYGVGAWYCDPSRPGHMDRLRRALQQEGLSCQVLPGENNILDGVQTVAASVAQRIDENGTPRGRGLYVAPHCGNTLIEFGQYQYPTKNSDHRDPSEKPVDANNHALDALRYALHTYLGTRNTVRGYLHHLRTRLERQQEMLRLGGVRASTAPLALPAPMRMRAAGAAASREEYLRQMSGQRPGQSGEEGEDDEWY